jgi:phosphotransferase system enzyme I (PtsI)
VSENREIRIKGRAVSRGVGIGKAVCLFGERRQFIRTEIPASRVVAELSRFENASAAALKTLNSEVDRADSDGRSSIAELLEGHSLVLRDPDLNNRISKTITNDLVNAEWAIRSTFDLYSAQFNKESDPHLREKYLDLEDVAERLLSELSGQTGVPQFDKRSVVAASELRASTLLQLSDAEVAGIVTEHGGWTSHYSILAREFGIPCVTGIVALFRHIANDTIIGVDGNIGEVIFDPSDDVISEFHEVSNGARRFSGASKLKPGDALQTLDGRPIRLLTNTTSIESYASAKRSGAKGIGLFRSEALIGKYGGVPNEAEQAEEYRQIADATGTDGVSIRTFDIESENRQKNPALGLRAIRLGLQRPELLLPQIRAILRASHDGKIKIVIPMVTDAEEMRSVRALVDEQSKDLSVRGIAIGQPEIGAMIEIPAAALLADQIIEASDFLCLGTNDLAQYVLAADRDNEKISNWFRTLHPAMLRLVRSVIETCRTYDKPFVVCGEMAGSPFYVPVLIGMGAVQLSIGPRSIEPVRRVAAGIAFEEAAELVGEIMKFTGPDDVERAVAETAKSKWLHLYPDGFFEQHGR